MPAESLFLNNTVLIQNLLSDWHNDAVPHLRSIEISLNIYDTSPRFRLYLTDYILNERWVEYLVDEPVDPVDILKQILRTWKVSCYKALTTRRNT